MVITRIRSNALKYEYSLPYRPWGWNCNCDFSVEKPQILMGSYEAHVSVPPCEHNTPSANCHSLAFGDSYSYVQGTNGIPGFSFIGGLLPEQYAYTPGDILGNKIIQNFTGTAEGGPNWLEFISGCAVEDGLWSPQNCKRQLWDFAVAGADVSEEL